MTWPWIRRILIIGGVLYLVALVPANLKPSWVSSPFARPDPTISIGAVTSYGGLPANYDAKVRDGCRAPWGLRPVLGSAKHITVILTWNHAPVTVRRLACKGFV